MITEKDLQEAIAECEGERKPNSSTCIKLAAFYTIRDHLYGDEGKDNADTDAGDRRMYSYAPSIVPPQGQEQVCDIDSDTEFADAIRGMNVCDVLNIIDELMSALQITSPRLYAGVMRRVME